MRRLAPCIVLFSSILLVHEIAMAQSPSMDMKDMPKGSMKDMPMGNMKGMPMGSPAQGATHKGTGTVKKLDANRGLVTLDHAPIETMRWPAMSMEFEVADKKMLDHLKPGSKVQFQFTDKGKGKYLITDLTS